MITWKYFRGKMGCKVSFVLSNSKLSDQFKLQDENLSFFPLGSLTFFFYKNHLYKNKEAQVGPKFKNNMRTAVSLEVW